MKTSLKLLAYGAALAVLGMYRIFFDFRVGVVPTADLPVGTAGGTV